MISKSNNFKQVSVLADLPTKSSKERYIYVNLKSMFLYGRQKVMKHESAAYFFAVAIIHLHKLFLSIFCLSCFLIHL